MKILFPLIVLRQAHKIACLLEGKATRIMIKERFTLADKGEGIEHATSQLRFNAREEKGTQSLEQMH